MTKKAANKHWTSFTIAFTPTLLEQLDKFANTNHMSRSAALRVIALIFFNSDYCRGPLSKDADIQPLIKYRHTGMSDEERVIEIVGHRPSGTSGTSCQNQMAPSAPLQKSSLANSLAQVQKDIALQGGPKPKLFAPIDPISETDAANAHWEAMMAKMEEEDQ